MLLQPTRDAGRGLVRPVTDREVGVAPVPLAHRTGRTDGAGTATGATGQGLDVTPGGRTGSTSLNSRSSRSIQASTSRSNGSATP